MKLIARTLSAVAFVAASLLASHGTAGSVDDVVKAAEEIALHDAAGRVEAGGRAGFVPTALLAEAEVGPKAGETFRDCPSCPEMVVVPAGSFVMGSPRSEEGRDGDEVLQHEVTISQPFAVGKHEVTFAEWDTCVSAGGCDGYRPDDKGWGRGSRPVIHVTWNEARSYVAWLSRKTGKEYRLLTEAEWEYAARAKTRTRYSWGDSVGRNRANCRGCGSRWDGRETAPAGSFAANGFGLHDMSGNVSEWVEDCWHNDYAGAPSDGSAWVAGGDCGQRVLRGGSWSNIPWFLRSAIRLRYSVGNRVVTFGFRVARTLIAPG